MPTDKPAKSLPEKTPAPSPESTVTYEQQELAESEKMADEIQQELDNSQLSGKVDVDFNAEYVKLNLNGSILFASGSCSSLTSMRHMKKYFMRKQ